MHIGAAFYVKPCIVVFFIYVLYCFVMLQNKAPSAVVQIKEHWYFTLCGIVEGSFSFFSFIIGLRHQSN